MGFLSGLFGGSEKKNPNSTTTTMPLPPIRLADYPEAEGARTTWWDTLQKWQNEPGYGAISPNWNDIWENARGKVQKYFMGGEEGPGAIATVRANLARKNMSENPASETAISRLGMKQGSLLSDIALEQAVKEAEFGESGRQNWLASIQQLAGLKPQYMSGGSVTSRQYEQPGVSDYIGEGVGALAQYYAAGGSADGSAIDDILALFGSGSGGGESETSGGGVDLGAYSGILSSVMNMMGSTSYENSDDSDVGSISFGGGGGGSLGGGSNSLGMISSIMNMFGNSGGSSGGSSMGGGGQYAGLLSMAGNLLSSSGDGGDDGGGSKTSKWGGAVQGGVSGAQMGSSFGPWGTAIGGILGAVLGYFTSD